MRKIKSGIAFHCHHDRLYEFVYDYKERVTFIKESKPVNERELRLKLFQLIPEKLLPGKDSPEWKALQKVREVYTKSLEANYGARGTFQGAWETYYKAKESCDKAWEAYVRAWGKEVEALHKKLCPNCPWDGWTIFNNKEG